MSDRKKKLMGAIELAIEERVGKDNIYRKGRSGVFYFNDLGMTIIIEKTSYSSYSSDFKMVIKDGKSRYGVERSYKLGVSSTKPDSVEAAMVTIDRYIKRLTKANKEMSEYLVVKAEREAENFNKAEAEAKILTPIVEALGLTIAEVDPDRNVFKVEGKASYYTHNVKLDDDGTASVYINDLGGSIPIDKFAEIIPFIK